MAAGRESRINDVIDRIQAIAPRISREPLSGAQHMPEPSALPTLCFSNAARKDGFGAAPTNSSIRCRVSRPETGTTIEGPVTEEIHGLNLMNSYLAQFRRGYAHTSIYLLRDRTDEEGNQSFGFYRADYSPRKAAIYLHNLTTILADKGTLAKPGQFDFAIVNQPSTLHELLPLMSCSCSTATALSN